MTNSNRPPISRFEMDLLHLVWFVFGKLPPNRAEEILHARSAAPPCLKRHFVEVLQDTLAKGYVQQLATEGGWRRARFLRGEQVVEGRLWERTPPQDLALSFSRHTLNFLILMVALQPKDFCEKWTVPPEITLGDQWFFFLMYRALRTTESKGIVYRQHPVFRDHVLCRLLYADEFDTLTPVIAPAFGPWIQASWYLEALQPLLAARWEEMERTKESITRPPRMVSLGRSQQEVLNAYLDAVEQAGRLDLARFLLQTLTAVLPSDVRAARWVGGLKLENFRIAERADAYRAATAVLRCAEKLALWERQARAVGYIDEGYSASQLWKSDWEQWHGATLRERAHAIRRELEPLKQ